jgi:hypothetical protein
MYGQTGASDILVRTRKTANKKEQARELKTAARDEHFFAMLQEFGIRPLDTQHQKYRCKGFESVSTGDHLIQWASDGELNAEIEPARIRFKRA